MGRATNLQERQKMLLDLILYAAETKAVKLDAPEMPEFLDLADAAAERELDRVELIHLTRLVQQVIALPQYTAMQAAAWLGLSYRALQNAVRDGRIDAAKPGHDLVLFHHALVDYHETRRYSLSNMM